MSDELTQRQKNFMQELHQTLELGEDIVGQEMWFAADEFRICLELQIRSYLRDVTPANGNGYFTATVIKGLPNRG